MYENVVSQTSRILSDGRVGIMRRHSAWVLEGFALSPGSVVLGEKK